MAGMLQLGSRCELSLRAIMQQWLQLLLSFPVSTAGLPNFKRTVPRVLPESVIAGTCFAVDYSVLRAFIVTNQYSGACFVSPQARSLCGIACLLPDVDVLG